MITEQLFLEQVGSSDESTAKKVSALLEQEGLTRDGHIDETIVLRDAAGHVYATGSRFRNTLRCIAVDSQLRGSGTAATIVGELTRLSFLRGYSHLFLYTRCANTPLFRNLGFFETASTGEVALMENRIHGLKRYIEKLRLGVPQKTGDTTGAIVMNANPFTLGHQYLIERAAASCDVLHLFVVSEDVSTFSHETRMRMVAAGTAHFPNVFLHPTDSYMISCATFPSYFLKKPDVVVRTHAELDAAVFLKIAQELNIKARFVGQEIADPVTAVYNETLCRCLPQSGVRCVVIPRKEEAGKPISASSVRVALANEDWESVHRLVPETTWAILRENG